MNRFGGLAAARQFLLKKTDLVRPKFMSSTPRNSCVHSTASTKKKIYDGKLSPEELHAKTIDEMNPFDFFVYHES